MTDVMDDDRLELILGSVGEHLVTSADGRRPRPRRRSMLLAAAATVLVATLVGAAVAPVRETVGEWLRLRDAGVSRAPSDEADPGDAPPFDADLRPVERATAYERAGLAPGVFGDGPLGEPEVTATAPEGGIVFGWTDGSTTLWVRHAAGGEVDMYVEKLVGQNARVERLDGLGDEAWFIDGRHTLRTPLRRVRSDRVIWWASGGREYRLESDLPRGAMVDIARQLE